MPFAGTNYKVDSLPSEDQVSIIYTDITKTVKAINLKHRKKTQNI